MSWFIIVYLLLVILVPVMLSVAISVRTLPEGRTCPLCRGETLRLLARWLKLPSRLLKGGALQRRWCPGCGWEGVCRTNRVERERRDGASAPAEGTGEGGAGPRSVSLGDVAAGAAMDVRHLDVNGEDWRVLVQCWCEGDLWYGRLLFLSPTGRTWPDQTQSFRGRAPEDVLAQALAVPERTLECRLRDVVSDR